MRRQRRALQEASISFLDVISCGFGAIVLLLVIARVGDPSALEEAENRLLGSVKDSQERLFEIRGEAVVLDRRLKSRKEQLSKLNERVARLKEKLASVSKQSNQSLKDQSGEYENLKLAQQFLSEEIKRLLGPDFQKSNQLVLGIPADAEYIIFVIDNSGSMQSVAWDKLKSEMINILDIYPAVKGIQIMNCGGKYMFPKETGRWLIDSPAIRDKILAKLDSWYAVCNSDPAPGIEKAIRAFYKPTRKISIYSLGDDFGTRRSIRNVIKAVGKLNRTHLGANRLVRIHTIGFPVRFRPGDTPSDEAIKFAALMRELSYNNGGTFIGLNSLN